MPLRRPKFPARHLPHLIAGATCLALAAFAGYDLYRERINATLDEKRSTANLARLLEDVVRQNLRRIDRTVSEGSARVAAVAEADRARHAELQQQLAALAAGDEMVRGFMLLDAQGRRLFATSAEAKPPSDASAARACTAPHSAAETSRVAVGLLGIGRAEQDAAGRWLWPVGRCLVGPSGVVQGTLVAFIDPDRLQASFAAIDTGANGFVTLFHTQGWLLLTTPRNPKLFERNWVDAPMFTEHLPRAAVGTVQQVVVRDKTERIYSYRALPEYPLVVSVGVSLTDALAEWRARVLWDALLFAAVAFALLGAATLQSRQQVRREADQRALADASKQTQAIIDHAADGIVTFDAQGKVESINHAGESIFGFSAAQLRGQRVTLIVPSLLDAAASTSADADPRSDAQGRHSDGRLFPIEIAVTQTRRAEAVFSIALVRDVTEARHSQSLLAQARERTERSERFLRDITDNVPLRIAYADAERRYRFVNQAQVDHLGLPREAILGRTRQELGLPVNAAMRAAVDQVLRGEPAFFEFVESGAEGDMIFESRLVPDLAPGGAVQGFYVASNDVTLRQRQQQRIELALAERETLLREVYHRVKNNLQLVQSLLSLQRRTLPDGAARSALDDSVRRVRAMALVHEKLYQTKTLSSVPLPEYVSDLLQQVFEGASVPNRNITWHAEVDAVEASLDVSVTFGLLVTELVSNSLKHAFADAARGEIRLTLKREGPHLRLRVADNGIGLPAGFTLDQTDSMGLQLAASLAGQLGGTLKLGSGCEQPPATGAEFVADLPRLG